MGVSVEPGATALMVTPESDSSPATERTSPSTACFAAEYAAMRGRPRDAPAEATATIRPVDKIVGNVEVAGWGGRTVSIPFIHQKSTTSLLEKIRRL